MITNANEMETTETLKYWHSVTFLTYLWEALGHISRHFWHLFLNPLERQRLRSPEHMYCGQETQSGHELGYKPSELWGIM